MAAVDRVERLTNLLALLLETSRPLTLVEIAGELEGQYAEKESTRRAAFERDKAALREIGVPIESTVLSGGQAGISGYWIDRDRYELTDLHLEPDEMRALQVAVAAVRPTQGREALWKLGLDTVAMDADVAVTAIVPELANLPALREAAARRATVTFDYRGKARRLDPYGLLLRTGFWYVVGRDHEHDEQRTYRVDRITGDVTRWRTARSSARPASTCATRSPATPSSSAPTPTTTRWRSCVVDGGAGRRRRARARCRRRVRRRLADGAIEVEVPCANVPAFRSWVLGLLDHAEVIGPPDVRADVVAWLERLVAAR